MEDSYVAGFFDGEGSVGVHNWNNGGSYTISCNITNTDINILEKIHTKYGGKINVQYNAFRNQKSWYRIIWNSDDCIDFLRKIQPYLIVKKEQVDLALTFPINSSRSYRTQEMINKQKYIWELLKTMKAQIIPVSDKYIGLSKKEHQEMLYKRNQAKLLHAQGLTGKEISLKIGVSETMISKYLKKNT